MSSKGDLFRNVYISLVRNGTLRKKGEFAAGVGITPTTLSRILSGKYDVTDETIGKLISAYDVNPAYMYGKSDQMFSSMAQEPPQEEYRTTPPEVDNIIQLYTQLIKEIETIRRDMIQQRDHFVELNEMVSTQLRALTQERERTAQLNTELEQNILRMAHISPAPYKIPATTSQSVAETPQET